MEISAFEGVEVYFFKEITEIRLPLKQVKYGIAQHHNKIPIYPIFYPLKGGP